MAKVNQPSIIAFNCSIKIYNAFSKVYDASLQAAELYELATAAGLQPKTEPHWTAGYE